MLKQKRLSIKWSADLYRILKRCRHMIPRQHGSSLERSRPRTSTSVLSRFRPDADAGVFLQRDLFYVCACLDAVLWRARTACRWLSSAICAWQRAWPDSPWKLVRHDRSQTNDRGDLRCLRNFARADWLAFSCGAVDRPDT